MQQNLRVLTLSFWWRMPKFRVADLTEWNKTSLNTNTVPNYLETSPSPMLCQMGFFHISQYRGFGVLDLSDLWLFRILFILPSGWREPFLLSFRFYPEKKHILEIWLCWIHQTSIRQLLEILKEKDLINLRKKKI